jgi:hypothetical protein
VSQTNQTRSEENTTSLPAFRQVIKECIARDVDGAGFIGPILDEVLNERFPIGKGGVGHAHRRIQAEIRQQVEDFYAPRDWSPEPTCVAEYL